MKTLQVKYFDGASSKPYDAELTIHAQYWEITYNNLDVFSNSSVKWNVANITSSKVYTKGIKSFSYGEYPFQHIECESNAIIAEIEKHVQQKHLTNKYDNFLHKSGYKALLGIVTAIVAISCVMYFYVLPSMAVSFVEKMNEKYVVGFGDYVFEPIKDGLEIDEERSEKIQTFFNELTIASNYPFEIYVVNSDMLNAFAVSGGKIVVFSGLLDKLENSNQLAALLGHEMTHVNKRHVLKNVARDLSGYLFLSILFGDINGITTVLMENAHMFKRMNYTRDLEREADAGGYDMLISNGLNPKGMIDLFQILKSESGDNENDSFKYFSSHPMLQERIDYIQARIDDSQIEFETNMHLEELFQDIQENTNEEHNNNGNE